MDGEETTFPFTRLSHVAPISASEETVIFPPNLHEGIYIHSNKDQIFGSPERLKADEDSRPISKFVSFSFKGRINIVSWFDVIRSKVCGRCGGFSFAVLACFAAFFMYLRRRHQREKEFLLFLVQQKNQKIGLLLHQIAELNAVLAAHRKVPVLKRA